MQVKKFEARTMKEALEMVKKQLGPEAIILSARDNRKRFGLVGEGSIEVTAAISEEVLQKKKYAESKLPTKLKDQFQAAPAKQQKQVMEKFINRYQEEQKVATPKVATRTRYIDIDDEVPENFMNSQADNTDQRAQPERVKSAAQRAWSAMNTYEAGIPSPEPSLKTKPVEVKATSNQGSEISSLQAELASLKQVISQFQKIPQTISGTHPGADYGLPYEMSATFEKLTRSGISPDYAGEILKIAQEQMPPLRYKNKALVDAWTARYLMDQTMVSSLTSQKRVQLFLGPSGSGKTSTMVKFAAHAVLQEKKKVVFFSTDTLKVGAADQLRIYAQILNVPFALLRQQSDWPYLMQQLSGYDLILCDFPGLSLKSTDENSLIRNLMPPSSIECDRHLVLSIASKNEDLFEMGRRYRITQFSDVIFTGLDSSNMHGSLYNFSRHFKVPLHSFGIGSKVPEDYEFASKERVLDLIFKISKIKNQAQSVEA